MDVKKKEKLLELGKKARVSPDDMAKLYKKCEYEQKELGVPEDQLESRAFARTVSSLKRRLIRTNGGNKKRNDKSCKFLLLGKTKPFDFAEYYRKEGEKFVKRAGKEQAFKKGYIDKDGKYLCRQGFNKGKKLPKHDWNSNGFALVQYPNDEEPSFTTVTLNDDAATVDIPFCKWADAKVVPMKMQKAGEYNVRMSTPPTEFEDEYVDFRDIEPYIVKTREDHILEGITSLQDFLEDHSSKRNECLAFVRANIAELGITPSDQPVLNVDDDSLLLKDDGEDTLQVWFPPGTNIDFSDKALGVVLCIQPYIGKNGLGSNGCGYWVEDIYRVDKDEAENAEINLEEPW